MHSNEQLIIMGYSLRHPFHRCVCLPARVPARAYIF